MRRINTAVRRVLACGVVAAGLVLLAAGLRGVVPSGLVGRTTVVSASGLCAVLWILTALAAERSRVREGQGSSGSILAPLACVLAAVGFAFAGVGRVGMVGDDFFILQDALTGRGSAFLTSLTVGVHEVFYRPVMYWVLWLFGQAFGASPGPWHLANVVMHLASTALLFAIALRLGLGRWWAALAALWFGLHGSRPESVAWITGNFELMSGLFFLASLALHLREKGCGFGFSRALSLAAFLAALWSKESGYALPLVLAVLPREEGETAALRVRRVSPYFVLAGLAFAHRWVVFGSLGGYTKDGQWASGLAVAKLMAYRLWGALMFPVNWDTPAGAALVASLAIALGLMTAVAWRGGRSPAFHFGLAAAALMALPAAGQMLIGADLQKGRLLYLPSAGLAIALAALAESVPRKALSAAAGAALVCFQSVALWHNMKPWYEVGALSTRACAEARRLVPESSRVVAASGLPGSIRGVYFVSAT